jgi:UDP-N-acetylmuramoylalanine--D-glutamate ligase
MPSILETETQRESRFSQVEMGDRIDRFLADPSGRLFLVVGLGLSGHASSLFLLSKGAKVRCTDSAATDPLKARQQDLERFGAEVELGGHTEQFCHGCEMVIVSPGVDPHSLPIVWADANGIPVISEIELAFRFCRSRIVGITGTNGKTTTCELTSEILQQGGLTSGMAGNIGFPFIQKAAEMEPPEVLVVEISSFQLERIHRFRPFISAVLNITEDHLDRHPSFGDYIEAKKRIAENQGKGDFVIVNEKIRHLFPEGAVDSPTVLTFGPSDRADLSLSGGKIISRVCGSEKTYDVTSRWRLRGNHNLENVAVAVGVAEIFGVPEEAIYETLSRFQASDHRIQFVDEIRGVAFFDDSKGTNVDAVVKALETFSQPVVLIAGGRDKGGDYAPLREAATGKVKLAVLIGEAQERLIRSLAGVVPTAPAQSLDEAVELAFQNAAKGDVVLLSPACSSFDMFTDYKHRGKTFQTKVKQLNQKLEERRRSHEAA